MGKRALDEYSDSSEDDTAAPARKAPRVEATGTPEPLSLEDDGSEDGGDVPVEVGSRPAAAGAAANGDAAEVVGSESDPDYGSSYDDEESSDEEDEEDEEEVSIRSSCSMDGDEDGDSSAVLPEMGDVNVVDETGGGSDDPAVDDEAGAGDRELDEAEEEPGYDERSALSVATLCKHIEAAAALVAQPRDAGNGPLNNRDQVTGKEIPLDVKRKVGATVSSTFSTITPLAAAPRVVFADADIAGEICAPVIRDREQRGLRRQWTRRQFGLDATGVDPVAENTVIWAVLDYATPAPAGPPNHAAPVRAGLLYIIVTRHNIPAPQAAAPEDDDDAGMPYAEAALLDPFHFSKTEARATAFIRALKDAHVLPQEVGFRVIEGVPMSQEKVDIGLILLLSFAHGMATGHQLGQVDVPSMCRRAIAYGEYALASQRQAKKE
jgi:hypothetical protein